MNLWSRGIEHSDESLPTAINDCLLLWKTISSCLATSCLIVHYKAYGARSRACALMIGKWDANDIPEWKRLIYAKSRFHALVHLSGILAWIVTKQPNMLIQMLPLEETVKMQHYNYTSTLLYIPYSRKIWRELNLADWPQPAWTKILANFNLVVRYGIAIRIYASKKFWQILIWRLQRQTAKLPNLISRQIFWLYGRRKFIKNMNYHGNAN